MILRQALSLIKVNNNGYRCLVSSLKLIRSNHVNITRLLTTDSQKPNEEAANQQSSEHQEDNDETVEDQILKNAMKYVPQYGFTSEAISQGIFKHLQITIQDNQVILKNL